MVGKPENAPKPVVEEPLAIELQNDIQEEVDKLQTQYDKRIEALERQNKELHRVSTEQFSKAVKEVEEKFESSLSRKPVCADLQDEVMKCYQNNPKETLNCAGSVKAYTACVQEERERVLTKSDEDCKPCMLAQMARGPCGPYFMKAYDCYLDNREENMEDCAMLYLDMKECWDKHPSYGYHNLVDKAYGDTDTDTKDNVKTETNTETNEAETTKQL